MSDKSSSSSGGIGFLGLLTILFIGLKLTNHIDWSWWWVLAPVWIPIVIGLAGFCIVLLALMFRDWWRAAKQRQRQLDRERQDAVFINRKR